MYKNTKAKKALNKTKIKSKRKKGFTLAEVLITLAIIGVIAALTIPALLTSVNDNQNKVAAKKAFSVLNQAYLKAVNENGSGFGDYTIGTALSYTKYNAIKAQMSVVKTCSYNSGAYGDCWASSGVGSSISPTSCMNFGVDSQNLNSAFVTSDGMYIMLYSYSDTIASDFIAVDVNGNKPPNDWGKDVFKFAIYDNYLRPSVSNCGNNLKHNDGTVVNQNEFLAPFVN